MSTEEQQNEPAAGGVTRDDLIEAVRAAGGVESVANDDAVMRAGQPAEEEPAAPAVVETPAEEDRVARILREREKGYAERMAAKTAADEIKAAAAAEAKRIVEEARAEARRAIEQEQAARRARLDANPIEGLRELGRDPTQMVDAVLAANTPEARERARLAADLARTNERAAAGETALEQLNKLRQDMTAERVQAHVEQVRNEFLSQVATPDKAPYLHARYDAQEIWERADALAKEWRASGLELHGTGENGFAPADVVAYLERQSKERIVKVAAPPATPAQQVSAGAALKPPGNAPQVSANGSRTLSAAQGSERRSSPKPFSDLTPAQKRADLIALVADTRRRNPDAY